MLRLLALLLLVLPLAACDVRSRVLILGLDGADWAAMDPLMDAGYLPTLAGLVDGGARAGLDCVAAAPWYPCFCPPVWNSIATGQPADVHGMVGFHSRADERGAKALWTVHGEHGGISTLISWRNTWPTEPEASYVLTEPGLDVHAREVFEVPGPPPDHPALEAPASLAKPHWLFQMGGVLPQSQALPTWQIFGRDRVAMHSLAVLAPVTRLTAVLADAAELTMVILHSPDKSEHLAWGSVQGAPGSPFDVAALEAQAADWDGPLQFYGTVASQYLEIDAWLAGFLEGMPYDYVVVVSDHGMARNPGAGLPGRHGPDDPEAHTGIFAIRGPGVRPGAQLADVSVLDVAPTVAWLLRLPVADDLPGRVLEEAFFPRFRLYRPVERVASW